MRAALTGIVLAALTSGSPAEPVTEAQVRRDCRYDAVRHCAPEVARYIANPVAENRMPIISCMLFNRDKLQAKCSRHLR